MVKILPAIQKTQVRFLGQEDPLEKEMATHSSILAWKIPWTEEPGGAIVHGVARVGHNLATKPPPPPNVQHGVIDTKQQPDHTVLCAMLEKQNSTLKRF